MSQQQTPHPHETPTHHAMEALLAVLYVLFPFSEGIHPLELAPAALMIAGFAAVTVFGIALSVYDALKDRKN